MAPGDSSAVCGVVTDRTMQTLPDTAAAFNLFVVDGFLSAQRCEEIIHSLAVAQATAAPVYGTGDSGSIDERVRKVTQISPSPDISSLIAHGLTELMEVVARHFDLPLSRYEEPQFLRYRPGDFFVAHQDGNTGMLRSEREQFRKVSLVIFLNRQSEHPESGSYCGGSLLFSDWHPARRPQQYALRGKAGMLVAFPSETTHEVVPVTHGERYSIVSWYR
jgi:SM-20-related protein